MGRKNVKESKDKKVARMIRGKRMREGARMRGE